MRLLIADDHTLFRDVLVHYIERAEQESDILLAKNFYEVIEILADDPDLDLILLDFRMPGMDGLKGLETLTEQYPEISVALMSGVAERRDVEEALKLGACGYLPKTLAGRDFLDAVKKIIAGEVYIPRDPDSGDILPSYYNGIGYDSQRVTEIVLDKAAHAALTPREKEVLSYLLHGASNKEIANTLGLQVVTVKLHVRGICRKLGAKNRTQAALIAVEMGFPKAGE